MRLQCPNCATEFDLRPPSGGRKRARVQFRCTECGNPLGLEELHLEEDEDAPSEMPSVAGMLPELLAEEPGADPEPPLPAGGDLPFEPPVDPVDPVVERFQAEMASLGQDTGPAGDGALLKQDGKVYHVRNTATIQRWIVERRVLREDLISTGGMRWEPVGGHPDLEIFFQMVERLDVLEHTGAEPEHSTRPPVADGSELQGEWPDDTDAGLPMPEEDEELSEPPSEISENTGPVYISEEVDDLDSEISGTPFAIRGAPEGVADPISEPSDDSPGVEPARIAVGEPPEPLTPPSEPEPEPEPEPVPMPPSVPLADGLPEMQAEPVPLGEADPETAEAPAPEPALDDASPLPVSTGPIDEPTEEAPFDEADFFGAGDPGEPTLSTPRDLRPPPVPPEVEDRTLALPLIEPEKDTLAWEEDRAERRQRLAIVAVIMLLLVGGGAWWWMQQDAPAEAEPVLVDAQDPSGEGEQPEGSEVDPDAASTETPTSPETEPTPPVGDPPAAEVTPAPKDPPAQATAPKQTPRNPPAERKPARKPAPKVASTDAGWEAMGSGDFNGARLIFVEAVAANPRNADAHYGLGYAAFKQGDEATAIRHYCKALELGPQNREIQQTIPSLLSNLGASCP